MSKLHSPCPEEHLDGNSFFENFVSFTRKFALWAIKIRILAGRLEQSCQNIFFCPGKPWWQTSLPGKILLSFHFFRPLSKRKEWLLPWIVGMSAGTEFSQSAGKNWPKSQYFEKKNKFLFIDADLQIEIFELWLSNFCRLVKSPSQMPHWNFFSKDAVFSKIHNFFYIFGFEWSSSEFPELFWKDFRNFFIRVQMNHSRIFCVNETFVSFFKQFWAWQTKFLTLAIMAEKIWAGSSKLFSASPEEDFEDKLLFSPFIVFFLFPEIERVKRRYY